MLKVGDRVVVTEVIHDYLDDVWVGAIGEVCGVDGNTHSTFPYLIDFGGYEWWAGADFLVQKLETEDGDTKNSVKLEERIKLIKDLIEHKDKLESEVWELSKFGIDLNLFDTMWEAFESYTECVSKLVGDEYGWLSWWLYDRPKDDPRCKIDGEWRVVRTVGDLVRAIDDSKEGSGEV